LHERILNTRLSVTFSLEGLFEKASRVAKDLGLNNENSSKFGFRDVHELTATRKAQQVLTVGCLTQQLPSSL